MTEQNVKFYQGQEVYLTAFVKKEKGIFYVCKGVIQTVPDHDKRQVYKVKIISVADRPVGGIPVVHQAQLLGLECIKHTSEIHNKLPSFMIPPRWINKLPTET